VGFLFFGGGDDKDKPTKKQIIKARLKKHTQINLLAEAQQQEAENLQELGGVFLDSDKNMEQTLADNEEEREKLKRRIAAKRGIVSNSRSAASKRWSVAATSSGAFVGR